jgi:valyl-tRNA synthetase
VVARSDQRAVLTELQEEVLRLARLDALDVIEGPVESPGSARLVVDGAEVLIPLAGVLDPATECARIRKRLDELAADAERSARKLDNQGFLGKAPEDVVEAERRKLASVEEERAVLEAQLTELGC